MKLWVLLSLCAGISIAISSSIILAIMVTGWMDSSVNIWQVASIQTQNDIVQVLRETLNFLKFASTSPPYIDQQLFNDSMPASNYDPSQLARMFTAYDTQSSFTFSSFGMLISSVGRVVNNTNPNGKLSWQIAKGFGCADYIYAFSDASLNPVFIGYCAFQNGTVDYQTLTYSGFDWGLKPEEAQILAGTLSYTFLPIFNLLGEFTLTHEIGYPQVTPVINGIPMPRYAVTFAEMNLQTFSSYVTNDVTVLNGKGYAYVVETNTGAMIASSIANSVIDVNGTRLFAQNSAVIAISQTFNATILTPITTTTTTFIFTIAATTPPVDGSQSINAVNSLVGPWRVTTSRYVDQGLDWTVYVVVLDSDLYGNMNYRIMVAALISMAVIIISIVAVILIISCILNRSVKSIVNRLTGNTEESNLYIRVGELDPIEEAIGSRPSKSVDL